MPSMWSRERTRPCSVMTARPSSGGSISRRLKSSKPRGTARPCPRRGGSPRDRAGDSGRVSTFCWIRQLADSTSSSLQNCSPPSVGRGKVGRRGCERSVRRRRLAAQPAQCTVANSAAASKIRAYVAISIDTQQARDKLSTSDYTRVAGPQFRVAVYAARRSVSSGRRGQLAGFPPASAAAKSSVPAWPLAPP